METLYKKDSKGKLLEWSAEAHGNNLKANIIIWHGESDGKISTDVRENIQGKNKGKINQTNCIEQARKDVESLYRDKQKRGYKSLKDLDYQGNSTEKIDIITFVQSKLSINTTTIGGILKPMKCQQYYRSNTGKNKKGFTDPTGKVWKDRKYYYIANPYVVKEPNAIIMNFPALLSAKINGGRCTIGLENDKVVLRSKEGLIYNIPHISKVFEDNKHVFVNKHTIFDGELYIHGESLQVISSAIKAPNLDTARLQFVAFDLAIPNIVAIDRYKHLKELILSMDINNDNIVILLKAYNVQNDNTVQLMTDKYIKEGYEGVVLRSPEGKYEFGKRPMTMVKLKRTISNEFKIIGIRAQDNAPGLGLFICKTKEGGVFSANPTMDDDKKRDLLLNPEKYVGKNLTIVFYEYTDSNIPFHIIETTVRDYE